MPIVGLELVSGLRVERARRADQEVQRGQVFLGHVGVEQHADHGGLHAGTLDAVRLHRVHPAVDGEPLQDDDPPAVVGACDQLTDADAAELPIGEFRRGARRGGLSAGHAEDGALQYPRLDRLPLGRAGGTAGQNLQCHTGFRLSVATAFVAALEPGHKLDRRLRERDRDTRTARPLGRRDYLDRSSPRRRRRSPTGPASRCRGRSIPVTGTSRSSRPPGLRR